MELSHMIAHAHFQSFRMALLAFSMPLLFAGCVNTVQRLDTTKPHASLRDIDDATWQKLAQRKIFFGHQSVGANVLEGIDDLRQENPQVKLNVVSSANPAAVPGPALVESRIGRNGDPRSKTVAFLSAVDAGWGARPDIALYKFCFADMSNGTDVLKMFDEYKASIDTVHAKYPGLVIVHVTMPLTTSEGRLKALAKQILGKPLERDLALKRNRFNALLHRQYDGKEPVFDLAAAESTRLDGHRVFFEYDSAPVYTLAPEFTDDGAHLNKLGRRVVAEQFLIVLARVSAAGS